MSFALASAAIGGGSLIAGVFSSNKASKAQKKQLELQREQLAYAKEKDAKNEALYGGVTKQVVDQAAAGVAPNLTQVSNEAATDAKTAFSGAQGAFERNQQRMGINPNSGRAEAQLQDAKLSEALAVAGGTTKARANERNNAETQTFNRRLQVSQMGNSQLNNSQNAITNAQNNISSAYGQQAQQAGQDAAGFANTAVNFGLKAAQLYGATPAAVAQPTGALGSGVMANQQPYQAPSAFSTSNSGVTSPVGNISIPNATNSYLTAPPQSFSLIPVGAR